MKTIPPTAPVFRIDQEVVRLSVRHPVRGGVVPVNRSVRPHDHEFTEICVVLEGEFRHVTSLGSTPLRAHDVVVVPPGHVHAFEKPVRTSVLNIYFLAEWFLPELRLDDPGNAVIPLFFAPYFAMHRRFSAIHEFAIAPEVTAGVLREFRDLDGDAAPQAARWTSCCFFKILLLLSETYGQALQAGAPRGSRIVWQTLVELDRLTRAGELPDFRELAQRLGVTRDHLGRLFHQEVGQSPMAAFQARRLQLVCRDLLQGKGALADIAQRFGYTDEAHLGRLFRRAMRLTPGEYRRKFAA